MRLIHSTDIEPRSVDFPPQLLDTITENALLDLVVTISKPRHATAEPEQNAATGEWIAATLRDLGYSVERQGSCANVIGAFPEADSNDRLLLIGAHYDSVPNCPGADDNASAVAAMLSCARAFANHTPRVPVLFGAFNREEDGFVGSSAFVEQYGERIRFAHILEMVGYASNSPGSQRVPAGLPIQLRDCGDFLGLLANEASARAMMQIVQTTRSVTPALPVTGLVVVPGAERVFPVLARSDHVPFWARNIPAIMWTDTAEFRNPNYHKTTDTPDTLDYTFLKRVTMLLAASVFTQAAEA